MVSRATGVDTLLAAIDGGEVSLAGRRFGVLGHQAALTAKGRLTHLALADRGLVPDVLFGPEHGYYGIEQDMIAARDRRDPLSGCRVVSLYGETEDSLRPAPEAFADLELLIIDLQDIGSRYYTFAATAVWAASAALAAGCEVWILDRPNPLGGKVVEGGPVENGYESFVGAFSIPVRHGLSLAELILLIFARSSADSSGLRVFEAQDWRSRARWSRQERFVAPSPNMPTLLTAALYPGLCLIEGTELSEGRGTTRPFQLVGAPFVDPAALCEELTKQSSRWGVEGVSFLPSFFRPQFQKCAGEICGGAELVVTDEDRLAPLRLGVLLLETLHDLWPEDFRWRTRAYEFVVDRPAIDLLAGTDLLRKAVDASDQRGLLEWVESWKETEDAFRAERQQVLRYSETNGEGG